MGRISTYSRDLIVEGQDAWIGSRWNSPTKETMNFSSDAIADYYNRTGKVSNGAFAWTYKPYSPTEVQYDKTFELIGHTTDTVDVIGLAGTIRVSFLTLANTQPGGFIQDQWLNSTILLAKNGFPSIYGIYRCTNIVKDGFYYLIDLAFISGRSGTIQKDESCLFGVFSYGIMDITATSPILATGTSIKNISVDPAYGIPTTIQLGHFDTAYNRSLVGVSVTGTTTKTLTLTEQSGATLTASWTDLGGVSSVFGRIGDVVAVSGDYNTSQVTENTNLYFTPSRARTSISLTTTGTSGAATYDSGTGILNIPNYQVGVSSFNTRTGAVTLTSGDVTGALGYTPYDATNPAGYTSNLGTVTSVAMSVPSAFSVSGSPITSSGTLAVTAVGDTTQYIAGDGSLITFPISGQAGTLVRQVRNTTGATLTKGTVVYISGATGNKPTVSKAIATGDSTSAQTFGLCQTDIPNNTNGYVVSVGDLIGLDTSAFAEGVQLYLSSTVAGTYTSVKQYAPAHLVYIGVITRSHPTLGQIEVKIQNGYELDELHNVSAQTPSNNDGLFYESATSLWKNKSIPTILGYTPEQPLTFSSPLVRTTNTISIPAATSSVNGYLSSTDWATFNAKQAAGNYITELTGEATALGPGSASVTLSNSAVTGKVLTGLNLTPGGSIVATDTILAAFGKVQNQISALVGGVIYKGVWNASTNTPTLTSSVGTQGWYYIVNVAGSTNLDGITDWKVGDWAIYNGTAWNKVDNTDAVSSVNGQTGAVSLTTDNISEGSTNQYYLNSRARAALSFTAGSGAYNSTTGVITIPTDTNQLTNGANYITLSSLSGVSPIGYNNTTGAISISQSNATTNGYLSSTDWSTFNNKQTALNGTGFVKISGTTISYDNSTYLTTSAASSSYLALTGGTLTGGLVINPANTAVVGLDVASDTVTFRSDNTEGFKRQLTTTMGSGTLVKVQAAGYGGTYVTDLGFYTSSSSAVNTTPNIYLTGGNNRVGINTATPAYVLDVVGTAGISGQLTLGSTITNGTYTYTLPSATGTLALVGGTGVGTVTSVAALTIGTTGTDITSTVANSTTTPVITLNIPTASAINRGALSSTDWTTFNSKQAALSGTGFVKISGTTISYDNSTYLTTSSAASTYVPYTGATSNVDLNFRTLSALTLTAQGSASEGGVLNIKKFATRTVAGSGYFSLFAADGSIGFYENTAGVAKQFNLLTSNIANYATRNYTLPSTDGTFALTSDLSGYLPLTGGTISGTLQVGGTFNQLYLGASKSSLYLDASRYVMSTISTYGIAFEIGVTPVMSIPTSGNVLINTTTDAGYKLDVNGTGRFSGALSGTSATFGGLTVDNNQNASTWVIAKNQNVGSGAAAGFLMTNNTGDLGAISLLSSGNSPANGLFIRTLSTNSLILGTNSTANLTIASGGAATFSRNDAANVSVTIANAYINQGNLINFQQNKAGSTINAYIGHGGDSTGNFIINNGTQALTITNSGNVLIGTTTDVGYKLDVNGEGRIQNTLTIKTPTNATAIALLGRSADNFSALRFLSNNAATTYATIYSNASDLIFENAGSERMRITSSGNVGIGTTSPSNLLDVQSSSAPFFRLRHTAAGTGNYSQILLETSNTYNGTSQAFIQGLSTNGGNADMSLVFGTSSGTSGATERMRITSSGNVGIGTTSPYNPGGSAQTSLEMSGTNYSTIYLSANSATVRGQIGADNLNGWVEVGARTSHPLLLITNNTERMRITSGGNVLIGTTSDNGFKLQVSGQMSSSAGIYSYGGVLNSVGTASNSIGSGPYLSIVNSSNSYQILQQLNASYNLDFWSYRGSWSNVSRIDGSTGIYMALSDKTKKKDFEESNIGLNEIMQLKPMLFRMKSDDANSSKQLGFLAQDVKNIIPQSYVEQDNFIGLQDRPIIAALTKAIQEQQVQIQELKEQLASK